MEKVERIAVTGDIHVEQGKAMTGWRLDLFTLAGTINAHSEAIEAQDARLHDAEHLLRAHTDNHATARVHDKHGWEGPRGMATEEAVAIIEAERDRLMDTMMGSGMLRVWMHAVAALMVGALRDHGGTDA